MARSRSRGRERSRSRRTERTRTRSRSRGLSRSVSRDLLEPEAAPRVVRRIFESQQEVLYKWLEDHKAEVEEKLQARTRRFSNKQIEKQFQVNSGFRDLASKVLVALEAGEVARAREVAETLERQLEEHEEDLIIADSSPHGWLAVARIRRGKELPKALRKRLDAVNKELSSLSLSHQDGGRVAKKPGPFFHKSAEPIVQRPQRRVSPEEVLHQAGRQLRLGTCQHCHEGLHYFRECPKFWQAVKETREAKAKGADVGDGN